MQGMRIGAMAAEGTGDPPVPGMSGPPSLDEITENVQRFEALAHTSAATRTRPGVLSSLNLRQRTDEFARAGLVSLAHTAPSACTRPDTTPRLNGGRPWLTPQGG